MTNITLAEKIAAVERAISDWDGCSIDTRSRDAYVLEAVLADLRAMVKMSMQAPEIKDAAAAWAEDVVNSAERRGAEEMRERAAKELEKALEWHRDGGGRNMIRERASAIRALPVE